MKEQIVSAYSNIERMETLQSEREAVMVSEGFRNWMSELNVSRSYVSPEGAIRAKQLNEQYDFSGQTTKSTIGNFLKLKGIW